MNEFITAAFATVSGFMLLLNLRQAIRDKDVKGVSLITLWFFTCYAIWMTYYFWTLSEYWVVVPAIVNMMANIAYLSVATKYKRRSI
jgi:uncharacterized protein with PQ loop repeat